MDFTQFLENVSQHFSTSKLSVKKSSPQKIFILSPHPDDECIVGSLPLRLLLENKAVVINIAVTLGSKVERQKARKKELKEACQLLGMKLELLSDDWNEKEKELKALIVKHKPSLILAPHAKDHHPTHIKTGLLLMKVLSKMKTTQDVAWTEFWGAMSKPNLLVEVPMDVLNLQMQALEKHVGEIERNPYHLRLPAWMMDNVRRGSELIGGKGESSAEMAFGVIYKLERLVSGKAQKLKLPKNFLTTSDDLSDFLRSLN